MGVGLVAMALHLSVMQGVLCKTWNVILPQSITGISGSCLTVPCGFEVPDKHEKNLANCSNGGIWKKGRIDGPSVFSARSPYSNTIQGTMAWDVMTRNCTTVFYSFLEDYSDVYFFRLDCSEHLRFSYTNGVYITVQPVASPPTLTSVSHVSEGNQLRLQCSVPVTCPILPPSITWLPLLFPRQVYTLSEQSVAGQMTLMSTLTFTALASHHNLSFTCSASYPLSNGSSTQASATSQRISVDYGPRFTLVKVSESNPVPEGQTVTFTCLSDANPPVSLYTWYRVDNGHVKKKGEGKMLILLVSKRDSGVYLCEAQTKRGSQKSEPVSLEVRSTGSDSAVVIPYVFCGVVLLLFILTIVVDLYKYQSLSRRLKQIELKGENTYANLRTCSVASDYDQLQPRQPKVMPLADEPSYVEPKWP